MTKPIPKKIAKLVLAEGDTTAAYDMEKVIVSAAGGTPFTSKMIDNSDDVGKKIVDSLKLSGKAAFPQNAYPASKKWNQYFPRGAKGSTLTPKTDFVIGNDKISLKGIHSQKLNGKSYPQSLEFSNENMCSITKNTITSFCYKSRKWLFAEAVTLN